MEGACIYSHEGWDCKHVLILIIPSITMGESSIPPIMRERGKTRIPTPTRTDTE